MHYTDFDHRRGIPLAIIAIIAVTSVALAKYLVG